MFIIFDLKDKDLASEKISGSCPNCNSQNTLTADLFVRYFHIFWIPTLPLRKVVKLSCSECGFQPQLESLPADIQFECSQLKAGITIPRYLFTGFVIALLAGVFFTFRIIEKDKKTEEFLYNPMAGDVYEIKLEDNHYSLCTIKEVTGDSIYLYFHKYSTEKQSDLETLTRGRKDYNLIAELNMHSEIVERYKNGYILSIERGDPVFTESELPDYEEMETSEPDTITGEKPKPSPSGKQKVKSATAGKQR